MESASKDVLFTIAMNSELPDLLRWCQSNSRINKDVCNNDDVWRSKLLKNYPEYKNIDFSSIQPLSLRETYVIMYQLAYINKLLDSKYSPRYIFIRGEIDLNNKGLTKVPSFNLPNLKELSLYENKLTEVPSFNLPNLRELFLHVNLLTEVPTFTLPNLTYLNISENFLIKVPSFNLPKLKHLSLYQNRSTVV